MRESVMNLMIGKRINVLKKNQSVELGEDMLFRLNIKVTKIVVKNLGGNL